MTRRTIEADAIGVARHPSGLPQTAEQTARLIELIGLGLTPADVTACVADYRAEYAGWRRPLSLTIHLMARAGRDIVVAIERTRALLEATTR